MTLHNIFSLVFDVFVAVVVYTAVTHRFNSHAMEKCVYSQIRHGTDIGRSSEKKTNRMLLLYTFSILYANISYVCILKRSV